VAADPIRDYVLTNHAAIEMGRRRLQEKDVDAVLRNPGQRLDVRPGRVILQSKYLEGSTEYLLRVFVDIDPHACRSGDGLPYEQDCQILEE